MAEFSGAGVPPPSTLAEFGGRAGGEYYPVGMGSDKQSYLAQNGLMILAAVVSLALLIVIFLFQGGVLSQAPPVVSDSNSLF